MRKYEYTLSIGPFKLVDYASIPDDGTMGDIASCLLNAAFINNGVEFTYKRIDGHPLETPRQQQIFDLVLDGNPDLIHLVHRFERYMDDLSKGGWLGYPDVTPKEGVCYYVAFRCVEYGEDSFDYTLATFGNGKWRTCRGPVVKRVVYYHPLPLPPQAPPRAQPCADDDGCVYENRQGYKVFRDELDGGFILRRPDGTELDTGAIIRELEKTQ